MSLESFSFALLALIPVPPGVLLPIVIGNEMQSELPQANPIEVARVDQLFVGCLEK